MRWRIFKSKLTQAYLHHTVRWCSDEVVYVSFIAFSASYFPFTSGFWSYVFKYTKRVLKTLSFVKFRWRYSTVRYGELL